MKTRKIFLEGYVQYVPEHFKGGHLEHAFVMLSKNDRGLFISRRAMLKAKADMTIPVLNVSVLYNEAESKFAVVFDKDGMFTLRAYQKNPTGNYSGHQMAGVAFIRKLKEMGFEQNKRYEVEVPEDGVIIVKKECKEQTV